MRFHLFELIPRPDKSTLIELYMNVIFEYIARSSFNNINRLTGYAYVYYVEDYGSVMCFTRTIPSCLSFLNHEFLTMKYH